MAEETYYARGNIDQGEGKVIQAGAKVTKSQLGDGWDQAVASGAIGTEEFEHAPESGLVGATIEAEERDSMEQAVGKVEGRARANPLT